MRYIKLVLSIMFILFIAMVAIWSGMFIILFSLIAAPILLWWANRKSVYNFTSGSTTNSEKNTSKVSYKIIEADYEIIDKDKSNL